jgi:hypothetical protein
MGEDELHSKEEAKKDFVPSKGLTTEGDRRGCPNVETNFPA